MLLAAYQDDLYNAVLLIHILAFLVTFAPAAVNPLLDRHFEKNGGDPVLRTWAGYATFYTSKISLSGLGVLLLTGVAMIVMSDSVIEFSQIWVSLAFVVWLAIGGVVSAMILKGERMVSEGDMKGRELASKGGAIGTVLMLIMLYLMVFKPGF